MGTRADFYVGRGPDAEWLGSIAFDGYPEGGSVSRRLVLSTTEEDYRRRVSWLLSSKDHATTPDMGWPWPWDDSRVTDYAYAFDGGRVWAHGSEWFDARKAEPDNDNPVAGVFPDMSARAAVTLGPRSGILIVGVPR